MKLTFKLDYHTNWGESVFLIGSLPVLNDGVEMRSEGSDMPSATIDLSPAQAILDYRYEIRGHNGAVLRREWGKPRHLKLDARLENITLLDHWQDIPTNKPFFASAFTGCIFRHEDRHVHSTRSGMVEIRVDAPMVPRDAVIAVSGNCDALGNWNPDEAAVMNCGSFPVWTIQLPLSELPGHLEFKFMIKDSGNPENFQWENHDNRTLDLPADPNTSIIVSGLFFENPLKPWRGSGTAIPVFSLRSKMGFGVGEFLDLEMMVDWAVATGQQFIQLLPVNDTTMTHTWRDSYPYTTNSTFALHPMYLNIDEMGRITDKELLSEFNSIRERLNSLPAVDYEAVNNAKNRFTRLLYEQQGQAEMTSPAFREFAEKNDFWLIPYSAWCVLRDRNNTSDMSHWNEYAIYDEARIAEFVEANRHDIDYFRFIQYHLDKQLRRVRDYAASRGVAIKGDIPIGISRCSVDAWLHPELFNLDKTAGAPPDDFATLGQNWGFPTYRWDVMALDGYAWWRSRLRKMSEYFSAYRIDHILGFFRIWQIDASQLHGLLGTFSPALPLTPAEMLDTFGFHFSMPLHTTPFITEGLIDTLFGNEAAEVKNRYLDTTRFGHYILKEGFTRQRAVADFFSRLDDTPRNSMICQGLQDLIDEVLFIEDPYEKGKYHPRIDGKKTSAYKALLPEQQSRFDALYEDFYYHRHNEFWRESAMKKLPSLIDSTGMLSCAEDLGMIPASVPEVMESLKILSLEIQRMPKEPWVLFGTPDRYPYLSVCATSTHDMPGIRQWWEDNPELAQKFYNDMLHHEGKAPETAEPRICREIVRQNLSGNSMLCILPLQDWLSTDGEIRRDNPRDEQINVPADPHHYWRYRMHLTLEQLLGADDFNSRMREMIVESER